MAKKQSQWFLFGLGAFVGAASSRLVAHRRTEVPVPHLDVWQRELTKTRGAVEAALLAGRVRERYTALYAQRPHFAHPALRDHLVSSILPGLALYQVLQAELPPETVLDETEKLFAPVFKGQSALFPYIRMLPDPFAVFRGVCKLFLRFSFPAAGWEMTMTEDNDDCIGFDVTNHCFYRDVLTAFGAPELTGVFCTMDDLVYAQLAPEIVFVRTKTLGRGDDCCNFRYCRAASLEETQAEDEG